MANPVDTIYDDFEGATNVMESGLLRVLTKKSSTSTSELRALADDPEIEVIVGPPVAEAEIAAAPPTPSVPPTTSTAPPPPAPVADDTTETAAPPFTPLAFAQPGAGFDPDTTMSVELPRRRSRVPAVALVLVVLALVAGGLTFELHRRGQAAPPPPPLPRYVVLPVAPAPPAPPDVEPAPAEPAPPAQAAPVTPATTHAVAKSHRHRHHRQRSTR